MRGKLADFVDIQEWASSKLKASAEFNQFCMDTIGSELKFYSSFPFRQRIEEEDLPAIVFYSEVFEGSNVSTGDYFRTWTLPFVIQIVPNRGFIDVSGVESWTSTKDIKLISYKACEILENIAEGCGINGKPIRFLSIESLSTTDIDEADDLQAQIAVKFGQENSI